MQRSIHPAAATWSVRHQDRLLPVLALLLPLLLTASLAAAVTGQRAQDEVEPAAAAALPSAQFESDAAQEVDTGAAPSSAPTAETMAPDALASGDTEPPVELAAPGGADGLTEQPQPEVAEVAEVAEDVGAVEAAEVVVVTDDTVNTDEAQAGDAEPGASDPTAAPEIMAARPGTAPASPQGERASAAVAADGRSESERTFATEFPAHAAARQADDPSTRSWAVLVGVNRYQGRTSNTLGSVADVLVLRGELLRSGWRDDHILVLTDAAATHDRIIRGIEWLIRSTDASSTVVFSFSGHMRHDRGVSALWPTDNRYIWAPEFGRMLGAVPAGRLWASLQGCHAEGMRAPGLEGAGRVITYSSQTAQKSYEDPEVGHSVQGFYLFAEGFRDGHGDADGDGRVSVQEAFGWAAPRAHIRTAEQQTPVISDGAGAPFHLAIGA